MKKEKSNLKIKNFYFLIIVLSFSFLSFNLVSAATLYFEPASVRLGVGDSAKVDLLLDSPESVNAIEAAIAAPTNLVDIAEITDGNSVISFWVVKPKLENGAISFVGAIPGGYSALKGKIFSLVLKAKNSGSGLVSLKHAQALMNDGEGTPTKLVLKNLSLVVQNLSTGLTVPEVADNDPPEIFSPEVGKDPNIFDGQYFVVFAAQDKESGIDYYEVAEKRGAFEPIPDAWERAESPYLLKDQELKSWIFVRAVDKKGNTREVVLKPISAPWYKNSWVIAAFLSAFVILTLALRRGFLRKF